MELRTKWFVRLLAIWALILTVTGIASLLLLTQTIEAYSNRFGNQTQVWIIFILQVCFAIAFAASIYGLWQFQSWGRILFLWASAIWFGLNLLALFLPEIIPLSIRQYTLTELMLNSLRYIVAIGIPLWYLNIAHVKAIFEHRTPDNLATEEIT